MMPRTPSLGDVPFSTSAFAPLAAVVDRVLGLHRLQQMYDSLAGGDFVASALARLDITVAVHDAASIPASGPVVIVANHPTGAADGLALLSAVRTRRPDVRVLGNHLLTRIPELRDCTIAVNPFVAGARANLPGVRAAQRWLATGGALIVFPAGEVSSVRGRNGGMVDRAWHASVVKLIRASGASAVPVFVNGATSWLFRLAGRVHPLARTALLPRELLRQRHRTVGVIVGGTVSAARLELLPDDEARLAYLRARTYGLAPDAPPRGRLVRRVRRKDVAPLAGPCAPETVAREIDALSPSSLVASGAVFDVFVASAHAIPTALLEIGRLREITFRDAGEGTGQARDLDRFDARYQHLVLWHRERREIAGAYRVGPTDRIADAEGPRGLYSRTLFRFGPALLREIGPALELGRSFVRREYQRDPAALFLLWKGIGQLVVREPRYRRLFGPVSISADYRSLSRELLARFLTSSGLVSPLARLVRPRRPVRPEAEATSLVRTRVVSQLADLEAFVTEIERGRSLPVLVRQYLKLNARMLGVSVDPDFGNVLDGLLLVDLLDLPPAALNRYLGREGAARFRAFHQAHRGQASSWDTGPVGLGAPVSS
jgi:putative hemolysin